MKNNKGLSQTKLLVGIAFLSIVAFFFFSGGDEDKEKAISSLLNQARSSVEKQQVLLKDTTGSFLKSKIKTEILSQDIIFNAVGTNANKIKGYDKDWCIEVNIISDGYKKAGSYDSYGCIQADGTSYIKIKDKTNYSTGTRTANQTTCSPKGVCS